MKQKFFFGFSDHSMCLDFSNFLNESGLEHEALNGSTAKYSDADIVILDLRFQNGAILEQLLLWPKPFLLVVDFEDLDEVQEACLDINSAFVLRDTDRYYFKTAAVLLKKLLNITETLAFQNSVLSTTEQNYHNLIEVIPDIVYFIDIEGNFAYINNAIRNLGYEPADLIGKHFSTILFPEEVALVSRALVLPKYSGKVTGSDDAPRLFDERRTGDRKTKNLQIKLKHKDSSQDLDYYGKVSSYGEITSTGVQRIERSLTGTIGIIRDISTRVKVEQELRNSLEEKETLIKEVHHRVKNNLQIISSLLSLQSSNQPEIDERAFVSSQTRIQSMALVHEQLYQSESLSAINLCTYIQSLILRLFSIYEIAPSFIDFTISGDNLVLSIHVATPIALIVNEIVSNSLKYAYQGKDHGKLSISIIQNKENCRLEILDDGDGFEYDRNAERRSLGLDLVMNLTLQINGEFGFENNSGMKFWLEFPVQN